MTGGLINGSKKHRILIVDDDEQTAAIIIEALKREGYNTSYSKDGEDALHRVKAWEPHMIVLDVNMPRLDGLKAIEKIRKIKSKDYVSVIFVSANSSMEDVIKGLDAGGDDYITKPFRIPELVARVRTNLRVKDLTDQLRLLGKHLEDAAGLDYLTGLMNMRALHERLEAELARARRYDRPTGLLMFDIIDFPMINAQNGREFGNHILQEISQFIKQALRTSDFAARYGSDEFLIVLPETNIAGVKSVSDRLVKVIEDNQFYQDRTKVKLKCRVGNLVAMPQDKIDAKEVIRLIERKTLPVAS